MAVGRSKDADQAIRWLADLARPKMARDHEINHSKRRTTMRKLIESTLASLTALVRDHLIDEFHFWIMPVVAGSGQRLFEDVDTSGLDLRLTDERRLENGSVILTYAPG
jgi:riboflavin biosynthesis pyrimidine reductase